MADPVRIALLQLNPTVGDLDGNSDRIANALRWAQARRATIALTPELALTGYPPEDLLLRRAFLDRSAVTLGRLAQKTASAPTILVCGYPERAAGPRQGRVPAHNTAALLARGRHAGSYHKMSLPNYGVFDERRYFIPGTTPFILQRPGRGGRELRIALSVCEDLWPDSGDLFFEATAPLRPDIILNLSASPYDRSKHAARVRIFSDAARRLGASVVCVNLVGGQDELVFDGRSFALDPDGRLLAQAAAFREDLLCVDLPPRKRRKTAQKVSAPTQEAEILAAIELSIADYVRKNGFSSVGVAMSGGIDSALVAAIAVRALGKDRVVGVTLPSEITSRATLADAERQARTLGIRFVQIPIAGLQAAFLKSLEPVFRGRPAGAADENLQARIRGTIMMALSNHLGFLLLATGNKSELATGYCTLYGDMAGGFAPIKDLSKTWVYRIARYLNRLEGRDSIPSSVIRRAPTAELRPGQKDQDSLPPYAALDAILESIVERDIDPRTLIRQGSSAAYVTDTARRLYLNEYKRRQAPIGPKISSKAFGRDRRMPITQKNGKLC